MLSLDLNLQSLFLIQIHTLPPSCTPSTIKSVRIRFSLRSRGQDGQSPCRHKRPCWINMLALLILGFLSLTLAPAASAGISSGGSGSDMRLILRKQIQPYGASDTWAEASFEQLLAPARTAIVITDMWDKHWCRGATERVGQIALRMEPLLERARTAGILIIHAPSETMDFYAGSEGRRLAQSAPHVDPPEAAPLRDPPLPIDDSNGGCDTPGDTEHRAWSRETHLLAIAPGDVISDNGTEIYNVLRQHGIDTVFYMGVHANMCILNRSFGIRQLARWGIHCILVRDLTDAMYEPSSRPFVSHAAGTELVIEYIEQHWAPTVTGVQMMQALPGTSPSGKNSGESH
jgi:nicotinamidase-related amidase